jgi:DNA repair exonuclease SbcCD ATPase subunit
LKDLETQFSDDKQQLQSKVDAGGNSVSIRNVENQIEQTIRDSEKQLRDRLNEIDSQSYGDNNKPATVEALENQVQTLEFEKREIEAMRQASSKEREEKQRIIGQEIRALEELLDPLNDRQRAIDLDRRPLRKQQMALEKERMMSQPMWDELEERREPIQRAREEYQETAWKDFENWQREGNREIEKLQKEGQRKIETLQQEMGQQGESEMREARDEMEARMWALQETRDQLEDAFDDEVESAIEELDNQTEQLREEYMLPLEEQARELDTEIEIKWVTLDDLYEQQGTLTSQLKEVEQTVRELDREAEFGVIEVISGALENAEELEKQGGIDSFDRFLPQIGGDGGPSGGQ